MNTSRTAKFIRATTLSGGAGLVTAVLNALLTKALAFYLGPEGLGKYALLNQTVVAIGSVVTFGGGGAVIQGLARREGEARRRYAGASIAMYLVMFVFGTLAIALGAATAINNTVGLPKVMLLAAVGVSAWAVLNSSLLTAERRVREVAVVQVLGSAIALAAVVMIASKRHESPLFLLILVMALPAARGIVGGVILVHKGSSCLPAMKPTTSDMVAFARTGSALLLASAVGAISMLITRILLSNASLEEVGYFEVAWSLSMSYVMLLLASFGTVYLPSLTSASTEHKRELVVDALRLITGAAGILIGAVAFLKPTVVGILFSSEFLPALPIVRWMLIGDFFKIAAYILAALALARDDMRVYLITEIGWFALFIMFGLAGFLVRSDAEALGAGFAVAYLASFVFYVFYNARLLGIAPAVFARAVLPGVIVVLVVSALMWTPLPFSSIRSVLAASCLLVGTLAFVRGNREVIAGAFRRG